MGDVDVFVVGMGKRGVSLVLRVQIGVTRSLQQCFQTPLCIGQKTLVYKFDLSRQLNNLVVMI